MHCAFRAAVWDNVRRHIPRGADFPVKSVNSCHIRRLKRLRRFRLSTWNSRSQISRGVSASTTSVVFALISSSRGRLLLKTEERERFTGSELMRNHVNTTDDDHLIRVNFGSSAFPQEKSVLNSHYKMIRFNFKLRCLLYKIRQMRRIRVCFFLLDGDIALEASRSRGCFH